MPREPRGTIILVYLIFCQVIKHDSRTQTFLLIVAFRLRFARRVLATYPPYPEKIILDGYSNVPRIQRPERFAL